MFVVPLATSLNEVSPAAFWEAVLLYHNTPHLVNRRLAGALNVLFLNVDFKSNIPLTELLTRTSVLYEVRKLKKPTQITQDLIRCILEPYDKNVILKDASIEDFKASNGVFVTVKVLLPRQQIYNSCVEVAILDKHNKIATFLAAIEFDEKALAPTFPYSLECLKDGYRLCVNLEDVESSASEWLAEHLFVKLENWIEKYKGECKVIQSLSLIEIDVYTKLYQDLKEKYGKDLVKAWPEKTDPLKYIYEDISIAAYLITYWAKSTPDLKPTFVDLGCGNGLLVHILNSEGFPGYGIDVRKRKIWDCYPDSTKLIVKTITPSESSVFPDVDWIIGNHSDELTPWIPVITARSSSKANFFLLPCCCYEFSGQKYVRKNTAISAYTEYLTYIQDVADKCGFSVAIDKLRIPSTRRTCLISASRNHKPEQFGEIDRAICKLIGQNCDNQSWTNNFKPRPDIELVKNCTKLDKHYIEETVKKIVSKLLTETTVNEVKTNTKSWNRGGTLLLCDLAKLLSDDLRLLKSEHGGLQTLLRNHRYIFDVSKGSVSLRLPTTAELSDSKYKSKPCWFNANHPGGCLNDGDTCAYKH